MSRELRTEPRRNGPARIYQRLFGDAGPDQRRVLAVIWATVDRDRLVADMKVPVERLADDPLLGASVGLVRPAEAAPIAVLEPITEGRLAATLARHGEGPAGEYVEAPVGRDGVKAAARAAGLDLGGPADGPFGRSVLVIAGPVDGPHLVLVEPPAGTIGR
jgi:hypothetical protein